MAFLDNSGDITIDAVLTDLGREKLARNDGSFRAVAYSFADDEIDYSQFDPTTGSVFADSKILQTPLMEANVNERLNFNFPRYTCPVSPSAQETVISFPSSIISEGFSPISETGSTPIMLVA